MDAAVLRVVTSNNVDVFRLLGQSPLARLRVEYAVAADQDELIERVRAVQPDVVLVDAELAGGSGYDACRRIKQDPALARTHVVILLATPPQARPHGAPPHVPRLSRADIDLLWESGADDVLALPVHPDDFYHHLAHTLHIRTPECHAALYDHDEPSFVLIMEDIAGSRQGDQFAGLTLDQAALTIEQAVGMHAPRWGDPTLADFAPHRPKGDEAAMMLGMVYQMMVEPFLDRLGPGLDADVIDLVRALGPLAPGWAAGNDTPRTVVHLDYRPDNFMFGVEEGAPPLVVVDWQTVNHGFAMWDIAYLIGGAFEPADRAKAERDLIDDYLARMRTAGVDYPADTAWTDYRLGSVWGVVMSVIATILAAETERGNDMLTVMAQRHGRHAIDLQALDLLG